jgi:phage host-nuclease inhibitor protein Gam
VIKEEKVTGLADPEEIIEEIEGLAEDTSVPVSSEEGIEFRLAKIRLVNRKIEDFETYAQKLIDKITKWRDNRIETLQARIDFFKIPMEGYLRGLYEQTQGKKKSVSVPSGRIELRMPADKFNFQDEDAILSWIKETQVNPADFIRVKEELNKKQIVSHCKTTGEVPPGVEIVKAERPNFVIVLPEEKDE